MQTLGSLGQISSEEECQGQRANYYSQESTVQQPKRVIFLHFWKYLLKLKINMSTGTESSTIGASIGPPGVSINEERRVKAACRSNVGFKLLSFLAFARFYSTTKL